MFRNNQTFEPRIGVAQLVFGVIYTFITLIALCLAYYVYESEQRDPYLHLFMALLFAVMAAKSFIIYKRVQKLLKEGVYFEAKVVSIEAVRGLTLVKGTCDIPDYGLIEIESRLVGETVCHELKRLLDEKKQKMLPALVVGVNTSHPRGMITIKCQHGHLIPDSIVLKSQQPQTALDAPDAATDAADAVAAVSAAEAASAAPGDAEPGATPAGTTTTAGTSDSAQRKNQSTDTTEASDATKEAAKSEQK